MDRGAKTARTSGGTKRPVVRKTRAPGAPKRGELEARLAEALAQQKATSEILRVVSRSRKDVRPVFDTIVETAVRLCGADFSYAARFDGELLHPLAFHGFSAEALEVVTRSFPMRPGRENILGRVALKGEVQNLPDALADPDYSREFAVAGGWRSIVGVPMLRDGRLIGVIAVGRSTPGPFPDQHVELLKTFADQAVIAVENVRLFTDVEARNQDLSESLEQQEATSEILCAIAGSPTDIQPVLGAVVHAAARYCGAPDVLLMRVDNGVLRGAAAVGPFGDILRERSGSINGVEIPLTRESVSGRAAIERRSVHVHDLAAESDVEYPVGRELQRRYGHRTLVAMPLLREGGTIGAIVLFRTEVKPFSERQLELLQTFADQAVIAIENVRLFTELGARNRDLSEALEQQTATSEILRAISSSPTNVQPVFDIIAERAGKLCGAEVAVVSRFDGTTIDLAAVHGVVPEGEKIVRKLYPMSVEASTITARVIRGAAVVHIADVLAERDYGIKDFARAAHYRGGLGVPIIRNGRVIGSIFVGRAAPGFYTTPQVELLKTFSEQAVIAIENVRLFTELEARNREVTEALERQTATSDVLKVISRSAFDLQPVLDTVIESAVRLCGAEHGHVHRYDGKLLRLAAGHSSAPAMLDYLREHPASLGPGGISGIAGLERRVVHWHDVLEQSGYMRGEAQKLGGYRTMLAVPMLTESALLGVMVLWKTRVEPFTEKQIELVTTFADQAVIAIENVRLFTELETRNHDLTEALEQQTATSEILRAISSSPTDVQPVFDIIGESAERLCDAEISVVSRLDGEQIRLVAVHGVTTDGTEAIGRHFPMRLDAETVTARAIRSRAVVHVEDVLADPDYEAKDAASVGLYRACLGVPMVREDEVIGAIFVARKVPGLFTDSQVLLLKTFADQAVIAIENVRLFTELGDRNRDLTEALEQQTATSEILRVISQSQQDVQPVFDTIAASALKLCRASVANVVTLDGSTMCMRAVANVSQEGADALSVVYPRQIGSDTAAGRAILTSSIVVIPDAVVEPGYAIGASAQRTGFRSIMAIPLLRDAKPIGSINVGRAEPGHFSGNQIALLQTFADQAVIAIENARLFKELETRTRDLTRSVGELKALGEVGQAVGSTLDLETVLSTIVSHATELAGMDGGAIYEYDEAREIFHLHTADRLEAELVDELRASPIAKGEGALGQLAVTPEVVEIRDIGDERAYRSRIRKILLRLGYRSLLAVPLLREDHLLGGLVVNRRTTGEFAPHVIELLETFATQSALAIQNARLFREIEDKSRQLEVASRHKSEFLANMSHELRTPLNAIIGFSEVLAERMFGEINDKQAEYLADILESGRHLLSLINDILDLSKIEAGRMELELSEFSLPSAIDNTLTLVRERAQRREIRLGRSVDPRVGSVTADERKVKQVLLNLLSNALKFTPEGGRVEVGAAVRDGMVEISVTDTGVGIAPEDLDAVFEEFRQVGTAAKKIEGTGLGLAISRKFIELHGGRIWVTSTPGVGSTFAFTLPLPRPA